MSRIGKHGNHARGPRVIRVAIVCETCEKTFEVTPGFYKIHPVRFCSTACAGKSRHKKVQVTCAVCQTPFLRRPDHVKEKNFCSKSCSDTGRRIEGARWRDKDEIKKYMAGYVAANRTSLTEKSLLRDRKNPDAKKARSARYRIKNKQKIKVLYRRRKHEKISGDLTTEQWLSILENANHCCLNCNRKAPEVIITMDHIVPLTKGGKHTASNVQPLCQSCNCSKGTKVIDYRPIRKSAG